MTTKAKAMGPQVKMFPVPEPTEHYDRAITPHRVRKYRKVAAASLAAYRAARAIAVAAYRTWQAERTDRAWHTAEAALDKALLARRDARDNARTVKYYEGGRVELGAKWSARGLRAVQAANRRGS